MKIHRKNVVLILIFIFTIQTIYLLSENELLDIHVNSPDTRISRLNSPNSFKISNINDNGDIITIELLSPQNNSIVKGGTSINLEFLDINDTVISPVTELYRWDFGSNFESILRPLPFSDGEHFLEVEVESNVGIWSYALFRFISDNVPHNIVLDSPENKTYNIGGGSNSLKWSSTYASGNLLSSIIGHVDTDNRHDVLVGGTSGRVFSFKGSDGTPLYLTPQFTDEITDMLYYNDTASLLGLKNGVVHLLDSDDGQTIWTNNSIVSDVVQLLCFENSSSYFILHQNELRGFNISNLEFIFNYSFNINHESRQIFNTDIFGNNLQELVILNNSGFVYVLNSTNGDLISNFSTSISSPQYTIVNNEIIHISSSTGIIIAYNLSDGSLVWSNSDNSGTNIYDLQLIDDTLFYSTSNGKIGKINNINGVFINDEIVSSSFIKYFTIFDFDGDSIEELFLVDGAGYFKSYDVNFNQYWNYTTSYQFNDFIYSDFNNDTFNDLVLTSETGEVLMIDPRSKVPNLIPSLTPVNLLFDDAISDNITVWEKYSWNGNTNTSYLPPVPSQSGVQTLEVWVSDNASNIGYRKYLFYSVIEGILYSPANNSRQQSGTLINLTFSETPLEVDYKWDSNQYSGTLTTLPTGQTEHDLYIRLKDQSYSIRIIHYSFITDDNPISEITLISPTNDTIVEGGETIEITFTEEPHIQLYSWDGFDNTSTVDTIPISSDTHILDVYAADEAMNWIAERFVFYTKIKISLDSHLNNSIINPYDKLNISFGESPDYYEFRFNNNPFTSFNDHNQTLNVSIPDVSQAYKFTIRVNDSLNGRWNEEIFIFVVQLVVEVTSHENNGYAETGDPLVVVFSDVPTTKLFSWDGGKNSSRSPIIPSPDGSHYLDIYVGNIEGQFWHYHYDFTVDTDLVDIILVNPTNNTRVNSWENITFSFSEEPYTMFFKWDNNSESYSNKTSFPISEGGHLLNVTVFDLASNMNSKKYFWIVDNTPINVSIDDYTNGSTIISGQFLNVSFNNEEPVIEWYKWDNQDYTQYLEVTPPKNGTHTLNITLYDGLNWNQYIYLFNVTDYPPNINLTNPNIPYKSGAFLTVETNETLKESWYSWNNGTHVDGLNILVPNDFDDGVHNLSVFCKDLGDSYTLKIFEILIDNTPISIVEYSPMNGSVVDNSTNITIVFSEVPYIVSYSWDNGIGFDSIPSIPTGFGNHILTIEAYDEAGNLLHTVLRYHISSPQEESLPILLVGSVVITATALSGYIYRKKIGELFGSLIRVLTPPKRN